MKRSKFIKTIGQGLMITSITPVSNVFSFSNNPSENTSYNSKDWLRISGVYPHLAVFNQSNKELCKSAGGECGIGAVVPWAGKLWLMTYSPHCPKGSADKLYSIDKGLNLSIQPESVGGTPAGRMIHKESNQLIIGPYFIDVNRNIRVIPPKQMPGRLTAVARHLHDPANKVYFYGMEGRLYEVNVHTLDSKLLFLKPVPGWHGKDGYTAQGRLILANNGDAENKIFDIKPDILKIGGTSQNEEQKGVLAEWDGKNWSIIRRRQFTTVTGRGGIYGAPDEQAPAWSLGWDSRSVILLLLDHGKWMEFRAPKSTHTYDSPNGWYTEWPRIRSITNDKLMMDMHGMFFNFPSSFSLQNISGISPLCNHLLMVTDFCDWHGEIVLSTDETSMMANKLVGQSQSNLWFGSYKDLSNWGPTNGWGGVWLHDDVKAGVSSCPYLINGFNKRVVHLSHDANRKVNFTLETYNKANNSWRLYKNISVDPDRYKFHIFPKELEAEWIKIKTDEDCKATAYFHYNNRGHNSGNNEKMFESIADIEDKDGNYGLIRPAGYNRNLQYFDLTKKNENRNYYEVDEKLEFHRKDNPTLGQKVVDICKINKDFEVDEASVIVSDKSGEYRLPKTSNLYDKPFEYGWPRWKREVITERSLLNVHGTFYEIANQTGLSTMRPICTHKKRIMDFCSWRGLLVLSGTRETAENDGHYFSSENDSAGLWFGAVDDLWKFGQPVGHGGPWKDTIVKANELSLPYLMTGYDKKKIELSADKDVVISLEVDFNHHGWHLYKKFKIPADKTIIYEFPDGYSAHWARVIADKNVKATVQFYYT